MDAVREMLTDPYTKPYRLLVDEMFNQPEHTTTSVTYNMDIHKVGLVLKDRNTLNLFVAYLTPAVYPRLIAFVDLRSWVEITKLRDLVFAEIASFQSCRPSGFIPS